MVKISRLKDGTKIVSLIPYSIIFSDGTYVPACPKEISEKFYPSKKEEECILSSGVKVVKVVNVLSDTQKRNIEILQKEGRLVVLPRVILDALNQDPEERVNRFGRCVGQKTTTDTLHSKPNERVADATRWMY